MFLASIAKYFKFLSYLCVLHLPEWPRMRWARWPRTSPEERPACSPKSRRAEPWYPCCHLIRFWCISCYEISLNILIDLKNLSTNESKFWCYTRAKHFNFLPWPYSWYRLWSSSSWCGRLRWPKNKWEENIIYEEHNYVYYYKTHKLFKRKSCKEQIQSPAYGYKTH